jgi:hypothetical protein
VASVEAMSGVSDGGGISGMSQTVMGNHSGSGISSTSEKRSGGHNRSGGYYGGGVGHKTWMLISYDSTTGSYGRNGAAVGAHNSGSATGPLQDFGRGGGKEASIGTGQSGEKGDNLELQFNYVLIV